jgi:hypothetical protein
VRAIPAVATPVLCKYLVIAAARPVGSVRSRPCSPGRSGVALCSAAAVDTDRRFRREGREARALHTADASPARPRPRQTDLPGQLVAEGSTPAPATPCRLYAFCRDNDKPADDPTPGAQAVHHAA